MRGAEGKFREDLRYRLNVVPIEVPPLRQRVTDIPLLVEYFIDRFGKRAGKKFSSIEKKSLKAFQAYGWPGNLRELQNVIERAVILSESETFTADETWLKRELPLTPKRPEALSGALLRASKLGLPARTLDSKIKRLRINKSALRAPALADPSF